MVNVSSCQSDSWTVNVPLSDLLALQEIPSKVKQLEDENRRLRSEVAAIQAMYSELLQVFGDLKRKVMHR